MILDEYGNKNNHTNAKYESEKVNQAQYIDLHERYSLDNRVAADDCQ